MILSPFIPQKAEAQAVIVGNVVSISTSTGDIMVTPHTLTASGWVEVQFKSRSFIGDVDVVLGFNGIDQVQTIKAESWEVYPHAKTRYAEQIVTETFTPKNIISNKQIQKGIKEATLGDDNLNANYADVICEIDNLMMGETSTINATIAYESFDGKTFTYKTRQQVPEQYTENILDWKPIKDKSSLTNTIYSKNGANRWQTADYSQSVAKDTWYKARFWIEIPIAYKDNPIKGKYNVLVKPSGISVQDALTTGNCILLDPWYNASWLYRKSLTINHTDDGAQTNYQMKRILLFAGTSCNITHLGLDSKCQADFDDVRFTTDNGTTLLDYWIESKTDGNNAVVWVEVDVIPAHPNDGTVYVYYGNAGAAAVSSGANTFLFFDDFERGVNGDTIGGSWTESTAHVHISTEQDIGDVAGYTGTRSAKWVGGGYPTAYISYVAGSGYALRYRLYKETADTGIYQSHGNGSNRVSICLTETEVIYYYSGGSLNSTGDSMAADTWTLFEANNINFGAATYDIWYNGANVMVGATMQADAITTNQHRFQGSFTANEDAWIDDQIIRKWTTNEPTWDACGSEEVLTPSISTTGSSSVEATTATFEGSIDDLQGGGNCTRHGFGWDVHTHILWSDYANDIHTDGSFGVGNFSDAAVGLPPGTTIYFRAYGTSPLGTGQGGELTCLTKPAAPTNVAATDGTYTDNVTITWTKSTGATGYQVYRDGAGLGWLGDVATDNDTGAGAPTITAGIASATDGASTIQVVLSIVGEHTNTGTVHTYKVRARNATGESVDSATDTGYRGVGALTYQWYRSVADVDAGHVILVGATTAPYNDTTGVVSPDGRWYFCTLSATGAANADTTHDRGYRAGIPTVTTKAVSGFDKVSATANGEVTNMGAGAASIIERGFDYGLTAPAYGSSNTETGVFSTGNYGLLLTGLDPASLYHYRAKAKNNAGGWGYGSDMTFSTKGAMTLYEEHSTSCNTTPTAPNLYGNNVIFQTFTTDNVSIAHTVSRVKIYARRVLDPQEVTISIRNAPAGVPSGEDITSATVDGLTFSTTWAWFSADMDSEIGLEANKIYAIVVEAPSGDAANYLQWSMSNTDNYTGGTGGYSADSGATWTTDINRDYCFQIWGNPTAEMLDAKVFSSYLTAGDWLITCLYYNIYPPYYDNGDDISLYFYLQLVDGSTVKAQTKVSAWGFKPGSIYLSPAMVQSLEWGKAYKVRMYGNFSPYPYIDYTLRPVDWLGSDMNKLAAWCRVTAGKIEAFYGETLTTYVTGKGQVLNAQGGSVFVEGIPELDKVLPNLFETATGALSGAVVESTGAMQRELQWENMWGPTVTRTFTLAGNVMSVSGSTVGAIIFFVFYILAGALTFPTGHTMVGIGISFPLILVAFFTGLIPLVLMAVLLAISTVLLVREFIWKGG
jgi:hypothetical protein